MLGVSLKMEHTPWLLAFDWIDSTPSVAQPPGSIAHDSARSSKTWDGAEGCAPAVWKCLQLGGAEPLPVWYQDGHLGKLGFKLDLECALLSAASFCFQTSSKITQTRGLWPAKWFSIYCIWPNIYGIVLRHSMEIVSNLTGKDMNRMQQWWFLPFHGTIKIFRKNDALAALAILPCFRLISNQQAIQKIQRYTKERNERSYYKQTADRSASAERTCHKNPLVIKRGDRKPTIDKNLPAINLYRGFPIATFSYRRVYVL